MKMKNMLYTIILSFLFSSGVFADWDIGAKAYNAGDYATALKEFRALAEQGLADAQYNLAVMYYKGQGVGQNIVIAYMWFYVAAKNGNPRSKGNVNVLAEEMKPKQITKAKKLARECIKKNYKDCG